MLTLLIKVIIISYGQFIIRRLQIQSQAIKALHYCLFSEILNILYYCYYYKYKPKGQEGGSARNSRKVNFSLHFLVGYTDYSIDCVLHLLI